MSSVAISGASGLVGSALASRLARSGHRVVRLVRRRRAVGPDEVSWDPASRTIDADRLSGVDAVVHLAGENIASGRWSSAKMKRIRDSRVEGTRLIAETLAGLSRPPATLINASAVGYYGNREDETIVEGSSPGSGFLAETCIAWESATEPAALSGLRVVLLRIGVVLSPEGGALRRMLPVFRLGLGGRLGHGRQFVSWIALEDLVEVIARLLSDAAVDGPVNAVAPVPVRNREFTRILGAVLRRPAVLPVPAPLIRLALGRMGRELLLQGARVFPAKLEQAGFEFRHGELTSALRTQLR